MYRRVFLSLAAATAAVTTIGLAPGTGRAAPEGYRISGPFTHENLSIYLVHGNSQAGPVPLTLQEAMAKSLVTVHETSNVNELQIENAGGEEVFIQYGDIVKGGKQDRVLTVSLVLPPRSGKVPIASFCVEQGRWTARGKEDVKRFASADAAMPSREAKIAMMKPIDPAAQRVAAAPPPAGGPASVTGGIAPAQGRTLEQGRTVEPNVVRPQQRTVGGEVNEVAVRQREVWANVARTQEKLAASVGTQMRSAESATSLQLSLENEKLKAAQTAYYEALKAAGEKDGDVIGYVFAVNGKLNSADIYPSNGLFRKMWPKLLKASATEAIGEKSTKAETAPAADQVLAFLSDAEKGKSKERKLSAAVKLETRDADKALYLETARTSGAWVHRNYLAK